MTSPSDVIKCQTGLIKQEGTMARSGLTKQECAEVLDDLRRQCPTISDEVLIWLAETFAFEAWVEFDPNDLIALLGQPGRKVIYKQTFSQDELPEDALRMLLTQIDGKASGEQSYSGGLLICRASRKQMSCYWPDSINEMMKQVRILVGSSELDFGVLIDDKIADKYELFILVSLCRN